MAFQEHYQPGNSPLHTLDPRVKIISGALVLIAILATPERAWPAYPLLWALIGSMAEISRVGAPRLGRIATIALPFALAALTVTFTTPGNALFSALGLTFTDAGLARFLAILLKSWLASQTAILLAMTTPFTDLLWALSSLRLPNTLVMILAFTYRYLFTIQEEAVRLTRARTARSGAMTGQKSGGSLLWRARVIGGMIGSLFIRSYERSERVYMAMQMRGYQGQLQMLHPPRLTLKAVLVGAVPVMIALLIEILALIVWSP